MNSKHNEAVLQALVPNHGTNEVQSYDSTLENACAFVKLHKEKCKQTFSRPIIKRQPLFFIEGTEFGIYSGLTSIYANEGEGKSQLANIICQNALRSKSDRRVVVLDTEQGTDETLRRSRAISFDYNDNLDVIYYPDFQDQIKEMNVDNWEFFKACYIDTLKAGDVVVIDVLSDLVASINDEGENKQIVRDLLDLSSKKRCAVIVLNHYNKGSKNAEGWTGNQLLKKSANNIHVQRTFKKDSTDLKGLRDIARDNEFKFVAISGIVEVKNNVWQEGKCRFKYGQWFGWNRCNDNNALRIQTIGEVDGEEGFDNIEYYKVIGDVTETNEDIFNNARREQLRDQYHFEEMPEKLNTRGMNSAFLKWVQQYDENVGDGSGILSEFKAFGLGEVKGGSFKKQG